MTIVESVITFYKKHYAIIIVLLTLLVWSLLTFNKTAPITEGSSVYSDMIISGKQPYADFELVFPPLYLYIITAYVFVFGGNLLSLRIMGIIILLLIGCVFYKLLCLAFNKNISAASTLVALFVFIAGSASTFSEYHAYTLLFSIASCYCTLKIVRKIYDSVAINKIEYVIAGILTSCTTLIRHPTGLMLAFFFIITYVIAHFVGELKDKFDLKKSITYYIAGLIIPLIITAIWITAIDAWDPFYHMVIASETKGSADSFATRWIGNLIRTLTIPVFMMVALTATMICCTVKWNTDENKNTLVPMTICAAIVIVMLVLLFQGTGMATTIMEHAWYDPTHIAFLFTTTICIALLVIILVNTHHHRSNDISSICLCIILGFVTIISLGGAISNVISIGWSCLGSGIAVGIIIKTITQISPPPLKKCSYLICILLVATIIVSSVSVKVITPYSWWCDTEYPYPDNTELSDVDYLYGIYLTPENKMMYEDFRDKCNLYLDSGDTLYCYSNTTVFYRIAHIIPDVSAPVSWPDTCRDSAAIDDANYLKENNPKLIMFIDHGWYPIYLHEELYRGGQPCGQRALYEWLLDCRDNPTSQYTVVGEYHNNGGNYYLMALL